MLSSFSKLNNWVTHSSSPADKEGGWRATLKGKKQGRREVFCPHRRLTCISHPNSNRVPLGKKQTYTKMGCWKVRGSYCGSEGQFSEQRRCNSVCTSGWFIYLGNTNLRSQEITPTGGNRSCVMLSGSVVQESTPISEVTTTLQC